MDNTCRWALSSPVMKKYHDEEWGRPSHDDAYLFTMLNLEGQQAGLSWAIILKRREGMIKAFANFEPHILANMSEGQIEVLLTDDRIIKSRRKILAVRDNARAYLELVKSYGTLSHFLWSFVEYKPIINNIKNNEEVLTQSDLSIKISKALKKFGFKYVGPVIIYSYLQAIGIIEDHLNSCPQKTILKAPDGR